MRGRGTSSRLPVVRPAWRMCRLACGLAVALLCLGRVPAAAGDLEAGRLKSRACVVCHGIDGLGKRPDTPNLAGQNGFYMAEQLRRYRSGRRTHPEMNIIAKDLSDQDIDDLTHYYSSFKVTVEPPE